MCLYLAWIGAAFVACVSLCLYSMQGDLSKSSLLIFHPERDHTLARLNSDGIFFEGWYFKLQSTSPHPQTMAFVCGVFKSKKQEDTHAFVFTISSGGSISHYYRFDVSEYLPYSLSNERSFMIRIGLNVFTDKGLSLNLHPNPNDDASAVIVGELKFQKLVRLPVSVFSPGIMGPLSYLEEFLECNHEILGMDFEVSGSLSIDEEFLDFSGGRGYVEKDWGRSFPSSWAWLQCNNFRESPGSSIVFSTALVPILPLLRPLSGFFAVFYHGSEYYRFATYSGDYTSLETEGTSYNFTVASYFSDMSLHLSLAIRSDLKLAALRTPKLDTMMPFCMEVLDANLSLTLIDKGGSTLFEGVCENAAFEYMERQDIGEGGLSHSEGVDENSACEYMDV